MPLLGRGYAQGWDIPLQQPSCARPLAKRRQAGRLKRLVGQLHMRETGVVRDLPQKPVEVCEVARVTAPVCRVPWLHHCGSIGSDTCEQRIYLCRRTHVVGKGKAWKTGTFWRETGISGQAL